MKTAYDRKFVELVSALDTLLCGGTKGHSIEHNMAQNNLVLSATFEIHEYLDNQHNLYYLNDGGFSRLYISLDGYHISLTSESSIRISNKWNTAGVVAIRNELKNLLVQYSLNIMGVNNG